MKVFELFGDILINDKASKSIDDVGKKAKGLGGKIGNLASTVAKGTLKIAAWGTAIGSAAVVAGGALANSAAAATDRIDKMSQKIGLSREGFQEWEFVLSQNGASIESLQMGIKTMTRSIDDLRLGTGTGAEAFERLGISIEDVQGLTQEEIFEKTVLALSNVADETERAALANDVLGRAGQELIPTLNAGEEAINGMRKEAQELGLVLGDDAIDAGVKFTDTMDKLKRSFGAIKNQLGIQLMPFFQKFADMILDNMPTIQRVAKKAFDVITTAVKVALIPLKAVVNFFKNNWQTIETLALKGARGVLVALKFIVDGLNAFTKTKFAKKIGEGFSIMADGIVKAGSWMWNKLVKYWNEHGDEIKLASSVIWNSITTGWDKMTNWIGTTAAKMWIGLVDLWEKHGGTIKKATQGAWNEIKSIFNDLFSIASSVVEGIVKLFQGDWSGAWESAKDVIGGFVTFFKNRFKIIKEFIDTFGPTIINAIKDTWDKVKTATVKKLKEIGEAVINWFKELPGKIKEAGKEVAGAIADGIIGGVKETNDTLAEGSKILFLNTFGKGLVDEKVLNQAGYDTVNGVIVGMKNAEKDLNKEAENLAKTTEDGYKEGMDIHSPSRVMKALGIHTVMGLMQGIQSKGVELDEESRKLAEKTLEVFSKDLNFSNGADMGADYTEGLATGIKSEGVKAEKTAEKTGENVGEKLGKGLFDKTSQFLQNGIDAIDDMMNKTKKTTSETTKEIEKTVAVMPNVYGLNVSKAIKEAERMKKEIIKTQEEVKKKNKETAESFATTASKASDVFEQAGDLIGGKLGGVLDGVGVSLGGVSEVSGGVAKAMTGDWMGAATSIMSGVKNLASGLEGIFGGLFGKRKSELDLYKEQWGEFVEGIDGELQTFAEDISTTFINAFEDIGKQINVLKGQIYATIESWYEMQDAMKESGVDTLIALKEQVEEFGIDVQNSILAIDEGLWDSSTGYSRLIKTIISGTGELVDEAMESSEALTGKGLNAIRKLVNGAMENIEPILKEFEELTKTEADKLGDAITEALEKKYQEELEQKEQAIKDRQDLSEEEKEAEIEALQSKYDALMEADALENEALQLATAENQQELLALLKEYNPKWQDAGQSFGDKLINGLNSTKQHMYFAVKDILDNVDLVQNAMSELESQQEKITQATINQVQQQQAQQQAEQQAQQQQQTGDIVGYNQYGQPIYAQTTTRSSGAEKRDININITTPKQLSEAELMRIARDNAVQLAMIGG